MQRDVQTHTSTPAFQGEYVWKISSHTRLPPQSVHQSLRLLLTLINSDRQNSALPLLPFFPLRLSILPSYLTSSLTFPLFICLSSCCPCCLSTVTPCQRVTLKRLLYFYLTFSLSVGNIFLNDSIKRDPGKKKNKSHISYNSFHVAILCKLMCWVLSVSPSLALLLVRELVGGKTPAMMIQNEIKLPQTACE